MARLPAPGRQRFALRAHRVNVLRRIALALTWAVASGSLPLSLSLDPGKGFSGSVPRVTVRTRRRGLRGTGPQPRPWVAGIVDHETGKRDIRRLSGLRRTIFREVATGDGATDVQALWHQVSSSGTTVDAVAHAKAGPWRCRAGGWPVAAARVEA